MPSELQSKTLVKVVILGESGVGKTSIMSHYVNRRISAQHKPTIGADFFTKLVPVGDKTITMQLWDTAGQERFCSLGVAFYRGADCCVLVYDVNDAKAIKQLDSWHEEFLIQSNPKEFDLFPFVVIGNKIDISSNPIAVKEVTEWCRRKNNITHYLVSAKNGINIDESLDAAASIAYEHGLMDDSDSGSIVEVRRARRNQKEPPVKRCGC
uniref:Ras-related protein Rab7 n=1 Tax=Rhabditophanes sp. KR3021 TaxID=114890 RepID=A0AC35UI30_9BILA